MNLERYSMSTCRVTSHIITKSEHPSLPAHVHTVGFLLGGNAHLRKSQGWLGRRTLRQAARALSGATPQSAFSSTIDPQVFICSLSRRAEGGNTGTGGVIRKVLDCSFALLGPFVQKPTPTRIHLQSRGWGRDKNVVKKQS